MHNMLNITIFRVMKVLKVEFKDENNNFQGVFKVGNFLTRKDFQTYYLWFLLKISQHILVWDSELGGELIIYIIIYLILTHSVEQLPIFGSFKKGYLVTIFCAIICLSGSVGYLLFVVMRVHISLINSFRWLPFKFFDMSPISTWTENCN